METNFDYDKIKFLSFGSPLMDAIADVSDEFLKRNKIELNSGIHMKMSEVPFFKEFIENENITYVPGGCQFNTMRVFNWMLGDKGSNGEVGFLGSVGNDDCGSKYETLLSEEGIVPLLEFIDKKNTGICLVICNSKERAHITDLAASTDITPDFVNRIFKYFKNVELIYTELYIIRSQEKLLKRLANLGSEKGRLFGFNIPAIFLINSHYEKILEMIKCADFIFANKEEAFALYSRAELGTPTSIEEAAKALAALPKKNKSKKRVFIITDGPAPAVVCEYDFEGKAVSFLKSYPVKFVELDKIVDTNGAGDAFAGGFLSMYVNQVKGGGKIDFDICMKAGHWVAAYIIQKRGVQIPNKPDEKKVFKISDIDS